MYFPNSKDLESRTEGCEIKPKDTSGDYCPTLDGYEFREHRTERDPMEDAMDEAMYGDTP
jgi:hypothetical protein